MVFNPEREIPAIRTLEELKEKVSPLYIIDSYCTSAQDYNDFKDRLLDIVCGCIGTKELREYEIHFKFYKDDKETHTLQLRRFLYNVFLWYPLVELHGVKVADASFIIHEDQIPDVNVFFFKTVITALKEYNVKQTKINRYSADVMYDLNTISLYFSLILGLHYSDHTFIEMYDGYKDLIETEFTPDMQPIDIEAGLNNAENELVRRLKEDPSNPIGVILRSKTGLKTKQLREFMISIGLRPSLTGEVIPYPINSSILVNGLDRPSYMYIDALGARKPLLANNKEMGPVGYFAKSLNIAVRTLEVSTEISDCGSEHYVNYDVKTPAHLAILAGKYYYDEDIDDLRVVKTTDKHLIGKRIKARSIVTCACGQNHMCATCVGEAMNLNWDIAKGFSTFITEEYSKDVSQNVLSTKHLLTTKSEAIEFSESFYKWFTLYGEELRILEGVKSIKDFSIYINPEEIKKVEEFDPNSTYNTYIDTGRFYIINTKTGESVEVSVKSGKKIYIRTETSDIMDANNGMIPLKEVGEDDPIFEISIDNNELVKPFYDLISLIDSEKRDMEEITIDTISQRFLDIFVEAGIKITAAAGEIILNRICRKPDNVRKRPNFGKKKLPAYHFYSLSKVLEENNSPTIGLIFEQLQRQITKLDLDERTGTSYMDPFFKELVSTEPLMHHRRMLELEDEKKS